MGETAEALAHHARWLVASYRYPSHRLTHFRHAQLRGAACHRIRRQRFLRNTRDNVRCVWCTTLQKMKIELVIQHVKSVKNASDQQTRPFFRLPPLTPPFPPMLPPQYKKLDVSPPGILPHPCPILFYH